MFFAERIVRRIRYSDTDMHEETRARLERYSEKVRQSRDTLLGYPENQHMDYGRQLYNSGLFEVCIDNVGDPFADSTYRVNSCEFEREVIGFFAKKYELEDYWGYVTACGTEGNFCGIRLGREAYPDGVLYYSKDSHYSVAKASRLFRIEDRVIDSQENGEMDYDDFARKLDPTRPAIINANIGTTLKGAIDDLGRIEEALAARGVAEYHIHCDAALGGMLLLYLDGAPAVSFKGSIGSISLSGHKFIGTPIPCGVFVSRRSLVQKIETQVEYIGAPDNTLMGSRCGLSSIFIWYAIQERGDDGFREEARTCVANAQYLYRRLQAIGYPSWLNDFSNTVYFKQPSDVVSSKWQLAKSDGLAHIVTMQHVTREKLDAFVEELEWETTQKSSTSRDGIHRL